LCDWLWNKSSSNGSWRSCCRTVADAVGPSRRTINESVTFTRRAVRPAARGSTGIERAKLSYLISYLSCYYCCVDEAPRPPEPRSPDQHRQAGIQALLVITPLKRATRGPSRLWTPRFRERRSRRVDSGPWTVSGGEDKQRLGYLKFYMGSFNQPRSSPNDEPSKGSTFKLGCAQWECSGADSLAFQEHTITKCKRHTK
jgi:hypothetical protein